MVASFDLSADPELRAVQERLLEALNLSESAIQSKDFTEILTRARIACIDALEAYFGALEPRSYISARNEGAAISLIHRHVDSIAQTGLPQAIQKVLSCLAWGRTVFLTFALMKLIRCVRLRRR